MRYEISAREVTEGEALYFLFFAVDLNGVYSGISAPLPVMTRRTLSGGTYSIFLTVPSNFHMDRVFLMKRLYDPPSIVLKNIAE